MSDRQAKNIVSDNYDKKWLLSHELKAILDCAKGRSPYHPSLKYRHCYAKAMGVNIKIKRSPSYNFNSS